MTTLQCFGAAFALGLGTFDDESVVVTTVWGTVFALGVGTFDDEDVVVTPTVTLQLPWGWARSTTRTLSPHPSCRETFALGVGTFDDEASSLHLLWYCNCACPIVRVLS